MVLLLVLQALHLACCEGHLHAVESLLKAQANVHFQDRFTGTALEDSVRHHFNNRTSPQIQELLRKHGASLEHKMQEYAAKMCLYASQGMLDNIKILVENGIAVNVGDYDSRTPLHLAASTGWTSVVEYLVRREEIEINQTDRFGSTALDDAMRHGKKSVAAMLEEFGGLSKDNPKFQSVKAAMRDVEEEHKEKLALKEKISVLVQNSPETTALRWVRDVLQHKITSSSNEIEPLVRRIIWVVRGLQSRATMEDGHFVISCSEAMCERAISLCDELKAALGSTRSSLLEEDNSLGPIHCKLWNSYNQTYKTRAEEMKRILSKFAKVARVIRKTAKEITKALRRAVQNSSH